MSLSLFHSGNLESVQAFIANESLITNDRKSEGLHLAAAKGKLFNDSHTCNNCWSNALLC